VLKVSLTEGTVISGLIREEFEEQYQKVTSMERLQQSSQLILFGKLQLEWLQISPKSPVVGTVLGDSKIRELTGVNVVGVICGISSDWLDAHPIVKLKTFDTLVCLGTPTQLQQLKTYLQADFDYLDATLDEPTALESSTLP
jgi:K+/H+ antiporter YhaU regulatory subunit KhtT